MHTGDETAALCFHVPSKLSQRGYLNCLRTQRESKGESLIESDVRIKNPEYSYSCVFNIATLPSSNS